MATDRHDDQEFDFSSFIQSPMTMLTGAMTAADTMRKTMGAMVESVQSLQKSAAALESILERVDVVVSQIEAPAKVLGPEMERLAGRVAAMSNLFDRTPIEALPELFESFTEQMTAVLTGMAEIPKRLGPLGDLLGGAAGMFGMGRSAVSASASRLVGPTTSTAASPVGETAPKAPTAKKPAVQKSAAKKPVAKKSAAKKPAAKKSAAKKPATKK